MTDSGAGYGESSSLNPIQRGPKACTNCRRRKIKCDNARPICNQCRLRPPRSREPCDYPRPEGLATHESPTQMLETIQALRARIEELEYITPPDPSRVYLDPVYGSRRPTPDILADFGALNLTTRRSNPMDMPEPPPTLISNLVDSFLATFADGGYFFMDPFRFRASALLPLPFGHRDRPSPSLLSAVYLWGSVLSHVSPHDPYTPDAFLLCVLQNISQDLSGIGGNPQLALDTIQAEVLLSFYYLHTACPVQGRYHASVAASIAIGADLHLIRSPQQQTRFPPFVLSSPILPRPVNAAEEGVRINAFWAVVIINNYWVGAEGSPCAIPYGISLDTPWPGSPAGGGTVTKFLNGNDTNGSSLVALLAKASILLERIISFSDRNLGPPDPTALTSLDRRLYTFQTTLPRLPGTQTLVLTHALVDLAILRLHAPYARGGAPARAKCIAAASRVVAGLGATN
ncbi:Zn(2)-Cys(6) binuclear cluster domain-containing protein, partial [Mycena vulgaris]